MKLSRILYQGKACVAEKVGEELHIIPGVCSLEQLIAQPQLLNAPRGSVIALDEAEFLPVVEKPGKILCVGVNYKKHIEECGEKLPQEPVLFSKFSTALSAHHQQVEIPDCAHKIDYEAELVIVVGKGGKNLTREEALECVFGYTCGNDLSARDLQFVSGQWLLGKTPDGFAPVGPWVVTADEFSPEGKQVESRVNGQLRQSGNTRQMIFDCAETVRYISRTMTLEPGDLIFTGTPDGVILGYPEEEQVWLKAGDEVEVSIEGIGTLKTVLK